MSIYARSFTISFGRSPCPGQLPSSLRLPLSGRPPVVSKLLLHVLFCFTIRFSRYHAVRSAFRFPATAPLLYHPSSPLSTLFSLPRLPRLFSVFSFISFTFLYFSLHSSNKYIKILAEYLLFFYYSILSARIRSKACPLPILLHCFIIGLYFYEFVVNAANAKLCCDINGVDAIS